jgi:adenylylsulfate kinase-like enzyme
LTPRAVLLTGPGGVGKTTIAQAIGGLLTSSGHVTAVLDLDAVAQFGPPRPPPARGLRFHDQLRVRNLTAVWDTYRAAGARFMVVSGPVTTAEHRAAYTEALADCAVQVVLLLTPAKLIAERTRTARGSAWNLQAALDDAVTHEAIHDFTVNNSGPVEQTATEILARLRWPVG